MEQTPAPPKATVLVLSYNSAPALRRCLAALDASHGRDQFEVIVVDNGSMDESPRLDIEFPGSTFMRLPKYFGATRALNIGMRTAAADFIFFLAPEVVVEPDTVVALLARIEADESIAAVCPMLVDESGVPVQEARRLPSLDDMGAVARDGDVLPFHDLHASAESIAVEYPGRRAVMYRKFFIRALNWFDERYGDFGADLELAFQARRSQKKIVLYPGIRAKVAADGVAQFDNDALAALSADRVHGAAAFAGKHGGFVKGLGVRLSSMVHALGQAVSLQRPGFQVKLLSALLGGAKIDGTTRTI